MPSASSQRARAGTGSRCRARVEVDHRAGVDEAVDRGRLQPGGDAGLAVRADDGVGVPVRDVRRDAGHGQDGDRCGHADRPVHAWHRGGLAACPSPGRWRRRSSSGPRSRLTVAGDQPGAVEPNGRAAYLKARRMPPSVVRAASVSEGATSRASVPAGRCRRGGTAGGGQPGRCPRGSAASATARSGPRTG